MSLSPPSTPGGPQNSPATTPNAAGASVGTAGAAGESLAPSRRASSSSMQKRCELRNVLNSNFMRRIEIIHAFFLRRQQQHQHQQPKPRRQQVRQRETAVAGTSPRVHSPAAATSPAPAAAAATAATTTAVSDKVYILFGTQLPFPSSPPSCFWKWGEGAKRSHFSRGLSLFFPFLIHANIVSWVFGCVSKGWIWPHISQKRENAVKLHFLQQSRKISDKDGHLINQKTKQSQFMSFLLNISLQPQKRTHTNGDLSQDVVTPLSLIAEKAKTIFISRPNSFFLFRLVL